MENNGCFGVFSPPFILCIIFIFLKAFEVIDWSWWVVFIPLWLPFAIVLGLWLIWIILSTIVKIILKLL